MVSNTLDFTENYFRENYDNVENKDFDPEFVKEDKRDDNMYKYHDNTQVFDPKT